MARAPVCRTFIWRRDHGDEIIGNLLNEYALGLETMKMKTRVATLTAAVLMFGCAADDQQTLQAHIAACRHMPRQPGNYERRAACELEVESEAYLARHPDMVGTWRELIMATRAEYARADRGEQTIGEADANAAMLREAAETGTGCLTDACGTGSRWHFPANPPY